jgi:DNA-binding transcriptional MerR regulator
MVEKEVDAFRTIGELSADLGLPQHILRYWETRFPQLKPLTRAGNRRYYRAEDVALVRRINTLLYAEGYTIKGVQKMLADKSDGSAHASPSPVALQTSSDETVPAVSVEALQQIRDRLARAIDQ